MKIGLRGGHSPNCKGAMGLRDEQVSMRELFKVTRDVLQSYGHVVIDCNSESSSVKSELNEGTNKANNSNCDVYVTLHMNSFNGSARGTEAWCYNSNSGIANNIASRFVKNMSSLGTPNRGVKYKPDYHDLSASKMPAVILETLFCDNKQDIEIWTNTSWDTLARVVANAIDTNIPLKAEPAFKLPIDFDEVQYLVNNRDVLKVTNANSSFSAAHHYEKHGRFEGRTWK